MKNRCYNPKTHNFQIYGGKGITVCQEWRDDYEAFEKWALCNGYTNKLSIDRIDCDKEYSPNNCRWADSRTQANNRTNNTFLTYNGIKRTLSEWSQITGINKGTIGSRIRRKWNIEKILTTPVQAQFSTRRKTK